MDNERNEDSLGPSENQPERTIGGIPPAVLSGFADAIRRVVREEVAAARAASNPVGGPSPPASTGKLLCLVKFH